MTILSGSFSFELLSKQHDRTAFTCGNSILDQYLKAQSSQDHRKNLAAVFVCTQDGRTVLGYYTLSQYSVELDQLPESLSRKLTKQKIVPSTLLGRLAVESNCQGQGIGSLLLIDALKRAYAGSQQIASWAVIVDAKDDQAVSFYRKYGFRSFQHHPFRLFLPMGTIEKLFC